MLIVVASTIAIVVMALAVIMSVFVVFAFIAAMRLVLQLLRLRCLLRVVNFLCGQRDVDGVVQLAQRLGPQQH